MALFRSGSGGGATGEFDQSVSLPQNTSVVVKSNLPKNFIYNVAYSNPSDPPITNYATISVENGVVKTNLARANFTFTYDSTNNTLTAWQSAVGSANVWKYDYIGY